MTKVTPGTRGTHVRAGTEPANARTAPRLRIGLAVGAVLVFTLLSWRAWTVDGGPDYGLAVAFALIVIAAIIDILVLVRRLRRGAYQGN